MLTVLAESCFIIFCLAVMTLMHEVQSMATLALIMHRAQVMWFHLALIDNRLSPKPVLGRSIRWPGSDSRHPAIV